MSDQTPTLTLENASWQAGFLTYLLRPPGSLGATCLHEINELQHVIRTLGAILGPGMEPSSVFLGSPVLVKFAEHCLPASGEDVRSAGSFCSSIPSVTSDGFPTYLFYFCNFACFSLNRFPQMQTLGPHTTPIFRRAPVRTQKAAMPVNSEGSCLSQKATPCAEFLRHQGIFLELCS